jgi:hypothetical protein
LSAMTPQGVDQKLLLICEVWPAPTPLPAST